jgi:hypothetical protein
MTKPDLRTAPCWNAVLIAKIFKKLADETGGDAERAR